MRMVKRTFRLFYMSYITNTHLHYNIQYTHSEIYEYCISTICKRYDDVYFVVYNTHF